MIGFLNVLNIKVLLEFVSCVQIDRQTNILRIRKRFGEKGQGTPYNQDHLPKTWFSSENQFLQLEGCYAKTGQSPALLGINRQIKLQEPASSPYNNITTPLLPPSRHTHMHIQDPVTPILPQFHSVFKVGSGKSKTLNEFPGSSANPLTMTPQEKIKKLRRRQQLRAMLAIQKQQKQFGHETSESQHSICQKHTIPDQMQLVGGNPDSTFDMNSPADQNYSGTMSLASDDCSLEDGVLYWLQDIVAKVSMLSSRNFTSLIYCFHLSSLLKIYSLQLDVQLRLCIRDSLCRLAQSATQRQYAKDTGNTMKRSGCYLTFLPEEDTKTDNR